MWCGEVCCGSFYNLTTFVRFFKTVSVVEFYVTFSKLISHSEIFEGPLDYCLDGYIGLRLGFVGQMGLS